MRNPAIPFVLLCLSIGMLTAQQPVKWPDVTQQSKPWTRWWWMGSAVDSANLTYCMELYQKAGLGGLEVTPIYGVKGTEERFVDFLSPQWTALFGHTLHEAKRLGIGIDLANASGWPFGGPWVLPGDACKTIEYKTWTVTEGQTLGEKVAFEQQPFLRLAGPEKPTWDDLKEPVSQTSGLQRWAIDQVKFRKNLPLVALVGYSDQGETVDLSQLVDTKGDLHWTAPGGNWTLYGLFAGWHGKMVERAGPGGEGDVIDHFSKSATTSYLGHFDKAFAGHDLSGLRAYFNDSYEVDDARGEADFTPDLFEEFEKRRGYDLKKYLPALFGNALADSVGRVRCDFRETISDLLLENYTQTWHQWAQRQGKLIRNQAHGSPASLPDLYASTDIPEIEGTELTRIKFASSAAHVTGKTLVSSESATWLNEHFKSTPADVKKALDVLMLGGVNHIFYHGTAYSPKEAQWPGWLFYAAMHFNPQNSYWPYFAELNSYVARCQSFLQQGTAQNDVLLYFPVYDSWSDAGHTLLKHFDGFKHQPADWPVKVLAEQMLDNGIAFDYISDRQLLGVKWKNGRLETGNCHYQTILVPNAAYMPAATLQKLIELAHQGATVLWFGNMPQSLPGLGDLEQKRDEMSYLVQDLFFGAPDNGVQTATVGQGRLLKSDHLPKLMAEAGVACEPMVPMGLNCTRRTVDGQTLYFIVNQTGKPFRGKVPFATVFKHAARYNMLTGQTGIVRVGDRTGVCQIEMRLGPDESVILLTADRPFAGNAYPQYNAAGKGIPVALPWKVGYVAGGPDTPSSRSIDQLSSWTEWDNGELENFSGTLAYRASFKRPNGQYTAWRLNLGDVEGAAMVFLNGEKIATLWGPDYSTEIPSRLLKRQNQLEVQVTNGMSNRIAWMDKQNISWRIFYNTNFQTRVPANRGADGNFTAENWEPEPSGLLGPVELVPLIGE
ncbi:MAG: glycosyl hydrolase [Breznakibacter sp.]